LTEEPCWIFTFNSTGQAIYGVFQRTDHGRPQMPPEPSGVANAAVSIYSQRGVITQHRHHTTGSSSSPIALDTRTTLRFALTSLSDVAIIASLACLRLREQTSTALVARLFWPCGRVCGPCGLEVRRHHGIERGAAFSPWQLVESRVGEQRRRRLKAWVPGCVFTPAPSIVFIIRTSYWEGLRQRQCTQSWPCSCSVQDVGLVYVC
jgi:hypothetical protein